MWLLKSTKPENQRSSSSGLAPDKMLMKKAEVVPNEEQLLIAESSRILALFGVALATASAVTIGLLVPMLYGYAQQKYSLLQPEIDYCLYQSRLLWDQLDEVS
ncbi:unnamed protein product [Gongylonema pulchrum]|uniref:Col_cuticle_N domain-containing protein n=1 Tax=Gongylonema pulchrum TaxID=637853 RepID=A0A183DMQ9_9BILA|nr:unnamed protein product [Gongylonema pulchrum]